MAPLPKAARCNFARKQKRSKSDLNVIGQFGVGLLPAFMVAETVSEISRAYGSDEAWRWESSGADGYTILPSSRRYPARMSSCVSSPYGAGR